MLAIASGVLLFLEEIILVKLAIDLPKILKYLKKFRMIISTLRQSQLQTQNSSSRFFFFLIEPAALFMLFPIPSSECSTTDVFYTFLFATHSYHYLIYLCIRTVFVISLANVSSSGISKYLNNQRPEYVPAGANNGPVGEPRFDRK